MFRLSNGDIALLACGKETSIFSKMIRNTDDHYRHPSVVTREIGPLETRMREFNLVSFFINQRPENGHLLTLAD